MSNRVPDYCAFFCRSSQGYEEPGKNTAMRVGLLRSRFCLCATQADDPSLIKISRSDATRTRIEHKTGVVAVIDAGNVGFTRPAFFASYVVEDATHCASPHHRDVVLLHVDSRLSNQCELVHENEVYVVLRAKCPRLTKLSLLVKSAALYEVLEKSDSLQKLGSRDPPVVCRVGSAMPYYAEGSVVVIGCEPTHQGLLSADTAILVIHHKASSLATYDSEISSSSPEASLTEFAGLVRYTGNIVLPGLGQRLLSGADRTRPSAVLRGLAASLALKRSYFRVHILSKLPENLTTCDALNAAFLTKSAAALLGLTDGSWTTVGLREQPGSVDSDSPDSPTKSKVRKEAGKTRHVVVNCLEAVRERVGELAFGSSFGSPVDDVAFVSPQLWFHLAAHPVPLLRPTARLWVKGGASEGDDAAPPCATEFHLAPVHSPNYDVQLDYSALLFRHFGRPRYLCKGDIVSVSTRGAVDNEELLSAGVTGRNSVVFFKVSQIEGPSGNDGYLCDRDSSHLYQVGTTRSYVPATMEACFSPSPVHPVWHSPAPPFLGRTVERLQTLVVPFLRSAKLRRRIHPAFLLSGSPGSGKTTVVGALGRRLGLHVYQVSCRNVLGDTAASTEARMRASLQKSNYYAPCILHLRHVDLVGREKELGSDGDPRILHSFGKLLKSLNDEVDEYPVVVVATTTSPDDLSSDLASLFLHHVAVPYPDEGSRLELLEALLSSSPKSSLVDVPYLAQRSAGFALGDLCALVMQGTKEAYHRLRDAGDMESLCLAGPLLLQEDLVRALDGIHAAQARSVGAPTIPQVTWEDVGGLTEVKRTLLDTLQLPLQHPRLLEAGLKRSGILLYGPPGTGKTLLAKAVATECALSFLSVKGPELINMYVGQSEENVRAVFARGRSAAPCVIFFDELDSLAPNRGRSGDSGGVMDRVVSQLLAEMDGLNKSADVFVIGATNRPDLLDPAILRPGRFDQLLYVGIPDDKPSQLKILKALTRKFNVSKDLDLREVVKSCPPHLTGADFYSLCSGAMVNATRKRIRTLEAGEARPSSATRVEVTLEDFRVALRDLVPSVSPAELERYGEMQQKIAS